MSSYENGCVVPEGITQPFMFTYKSVRSLRSACTTALIVWLLIVLAFQRLRGTGLKS